MPGNDFIRPHCPTFITERLRLRMIRSDDEDFLTELDSSHEVMRFIHHGPMELAQARSFAKMHIESAHSRWHFHKWLVEQKANQTRVGWVELAKFRQGHMREDAGDDIQIGYEFASVYWGFGYATEACQAVIGYADDLALDRLVAFTREVNRRSVRVLAKLRFQRAGSCADDAKQPCTFYVRLRGSG